MNNIIGLADGNPGALTFLFELVKLPENKQLPVMISIQLCELKGTDLWILYSDLCGKDMELVIKLCNNCPENVLKDACKRQDRSGRALVAQYL